MSRARRMTAPEDPMTETERALVKLVCERCGSPIETIPGYPDKWVCPVHGRTATAHYARDEEDDRET